MAARTQTQEKPTAAAASAQVYLICGSDEFEVSRNAKHLVDSLCPPEERALGLEIIEGACDTVEEAVNAVSKCLDALCTVGFFGSAKVVWLRDASFLYEGKPGRSEEVKKAVAGLTDELKRGLMTGVRFVVSAAQVDKRTSFYKTIEKVGKIQRHDLPEKDYKWDEHAATTLRGMLEKAGLQARSDVINLIIERAGNQSRQLDSEVEKLTLYMKGRREIRAEDVMDIVSPARERGYGELSTAFSQRDLNVSLKVYRQLIHQKEQPVGLIISLENRVRELLIYRTAIARKWLHLSGNPEWPKIEWANLPEAETFFSGLSNDPRKANPFWAGKLAGWSARFSLSELQRIQRILVEEHGRMTDGTASAELLLEWALIKALGVKRDA